MKALDKEIRRVEDEIAQLEARLKDLKSEKKTEEFRIKITGIKEGDSHENE